MEIEGFIIETLQEFKTRTKTRQGWMGCWNKKIYKTVDIAEDAYRQRPDCYKKDDLQVRIVTMYRGDIIKLNIIPGKQQLPDMMQVYWHLSTGT